MKKTRELLMEDYNKVGDLLTVLGNGSNEEREMLMKERDNIRNELIRLDSVAMDAKMKNEEIVAENKREKIRTYVKLGTYTVSTIVGVWTILMTFSFDDRHSVTSTLGRGILNKFLPGRFNDDK